MDAPASLVLVPYGISERLRAGPPYLRQWIDASLPCAGVVVVAGSSFFFLFLRGCCLGGSAERLKGSDAALCWLVTQSGQEEEAEQGWREARLRATHSHLLPKAFLVSALKVVNPRTPLSPATTRMVGPPTVPNSPNLLDWCPRRLTQGHKAEGL